MVFLDSVLNPIFLPLININPFWGIFVFSLFLSVIITLVYKYFTNQVEMKKIKDAQKEFQKKIKEHRDKPEDMLRMQKEAMSANMDYMKHSLKAMLITFIPVILLFGWMNAHIAYEPIFPGETYSVTAILKDGVTGNVELSPDEGTQILNSAIQPAASTVTWSLKSTAGDHILTIKLGELQQSKKVLITTEFKYADLITAYAHSDIEQIKINNNELKPLGSLSLFGWHPGWLGVYIILSILFSIVLRKVMNVY